MPALVKTAAFSWPLVAAGVVVGLLLVLTLGLWAHYGTTVFFEMVRAGWLACF